MQSEIKKKPDLSLNYLVGIDLPLHIRDEINSFLHESFKENLNYFNLFNKFEYHITLAYLGKITQEQRLRLIAAVDTIKISPFDIGLSGLGTFPIGNNPKFLRLSVYSGKEMLNTFAEKVRREITNKAGLIPKDKFFPYITVSKIKNLSPIQKQELFKTISKYWEYPFGNFKVENFHLYRINKENQYCYNHEVKLKPSLLF